MKHHPFHRLAGLVFLTLAATACDRSGASESVTANSPIAISAAELENLLIPVEAGQGQDRGFADLSPLRDRLDGVRVLILGEPSHGDGAAFESRTRLLRFLHAELGFNVLAFESGLFSLERALAGATTPEAALAGAREGVFAIWSASAQALPSLEYAASTYDGSSPLRIAGMDAQLARRDTATLHELAAFLKVEGYPRLAGFDRATATLHRLLGGSVFDRVGMLERRRVRRELGEAQAWLLEFEGPDAERWSLFLGNARAWVETAWRRNTAPREVQMTKNLVWMLERDPQARIVVWVASVYGITGASTIRDMDGRFRYPSTVSMGQRLRDLLGDRAVYTLAYTASGGEYGTWNWSQPVRPLPEPSNGTLEAAFAATGHEHAVLDLRQVPPEGALRQSFVARPLGYTEMMAPWAEVVDGFYLIRTMAPSTRAP